jgi:hypothetical protein
MGGWDAVLNASIGRQQERRERKQALSDAQFQEKHNEIQGMIDNLGTKLAAVPDDKRNTPDYLKMQDQLAQAIQSRDAHWKSLDHPNAIMKFGKMLGKDLRFKKQEAPTPVAPPVYGQPTMQMPASTTEPIRLAPVPGYSTTDVSENKSLPPQPKDALNKYSNPEEQPPQISFAFNKAWAKSGPYTTKLTPQEEKEFRQWAAANPNAVKGEVGPGPDFAPLPMADYDVRGHFHASKLGDPAADLKPNSWDGKIHGNDKFKTPYNGGFSNESMYAKPNAPHWEGDKLVTADGRLVTDESPGPKLNKPTTTQQPGVEGATLPGLPVAATPSFPTGPAYKVQGPQTPAQMKAAAEAAQLVASAPLSPEQKATIEGQAQAAKDLAQFQGNMKLYDQNHPEGIGPNATPEGKQARNEYVNELLTSGLKEPKEPIETWTDVKGYPSQEFPVGSGNYRTLQVNKKGEKRWKDEPEGYIPPTPNAPKQSADERKRADFEEYKKSHTALKDQTFEAWVAEQSALGRRSGAPPISRSSGGAGSKAKTSPAQTKAEETVDAAEAAYLDVLGAGGPDGRGNNLDPIGSAGVVLSWLRGRVNRVTQTEINMVNNLGGAEMKLEGNVAHIVKGTISPKQYQYFLASTKRNLDIAKQVASKYKGGSSSLPPDAVAKLKEGHVTTFGNGQKWTLENGQPKQVQ